MRIAQRFSVGWGTMGEQVPKGRPKCLARLGRPFGTYSVMVRGPNAEALGYSRMCLRDKNTLSRNVLKTWWHCSDMLAVKPVAFSRIQVRSDGIEAAVHS